MTRRRGGSNGAGVEVLAMNLLHDLRIGQAEDVVRALEIARMRGETRTAIAGFIEPVALDHRAHRAVEDEDAAVEQFAKFGGTVGLWHSESPEKEKPRLKLRGFSRSRTAYCRLFSFF